MLRRTIGLVGSKLIRALAVALALLVPLQGMAAVTVAICMASEHHGDLAGHQHPVQIQDEHDHSAHSHPDEASGEATDAKDKHCGPCLACCASTSITGPAAYPILPSLSESPYIHSQSAPPGVEPAGLYKPPLAL